MNLDTRLLKSLSIATLWPESPTERNVAVSSSMEPVALSSLSNISYLRQRLKSSGPYYSYCRPINEHGVLASLVS